MHKNPFSRIIPDSLRHFSVRLISIGRATHDKNKVWFLILCFLWCVPKLVSVCGMRQNGTLHPLIIGIYSQIMSG
jgi:hypothetical protein